MNENAAAIIGVLSSLVILAGVSVIILNGKGSVAILDAIGTSFSGLLKAATSPGIANG